MWQYELVGAALTSDVSSVAGMSILVLIYLRYERAELNYFKILLIYKFFKIVH
jgi:hypothetical protein